MLLELKTFAKKWVKCRSEQHKDASSIGSAKIEPKYQKTLLYQQDKF